MESKPLFELYIDKGDMDWYSKARCQNSDTEAFFVEERGMSYEEPVARICNSCSVKNECLNFAIKYKMQGFWGGTTEQQRRTMRRRNYVA